MWSSCVPLIYSCLLLLLIDSVSHASVVLHEKILGHVGAGNYTYYTLSQKGSVIILLHTIEGDADVYVGEKNLEPTYDFDNHDFHSATCGLDRVDVPSHYARPLGIGIYGHPSHDITAYILEIIVDDQQDELGSWGETLDTGIPSYFNSPASGISTAHTPNFVEDEESQSLLLCIIVSVLEGILRVLLELFVT